ncbi:hypothetical protein EXIGLDRAFT_222805 [Exidia glandulosa HHB12029]|uniref:Uncharacterized protein n=1 Tax=Exidia glandulosa HHB12029 TaxID=1314781 RepID=A0A165ECI6_EXIGL|nr:hypothetical protein EXIGLDRAFT_222805 [Exidia glandulosa HHB12029]
MLKEVYTPSEMHAVFSPWPGSPGYPGVVQVAHPFAHPSSMHAWALVHGSPRQSGARLAPTSGESLRRTNGGIPALTRSKVHNAWASGPRVSKMATSLPFVSGTVSQREKGAVCWRPAPTPCSASCSGEQAAPSTDVMEVRTMRDLINMTREELGF